MKKLLFFLSFIIGNYSIAMGPNFEGALLGTTGLQDEHGLRDFADPELADALLTELQEHSHWKELIASKKLSVSLVDLRDSDYPRLASVNGDEMMYAASLPKIAILLACMDAIDKGELEDSPEVQNDLRIMISKSSNEAASRMIDRVGYDKISDMLTHPDYRLYDEEQGGGLWVGKRYGRSSQRKPDPMKGLSHAATTNQVARFYYLMSLGKLISPEKSAEMMDIMEGPELHHKFVNTLDKVSPNASICRKSGTWRNFHCDSALVQDGEGRHYILVALIDDSTGGSICRELVTIAERVLLTPASAALN